MELARLIVGHAASYYRVALLHAEAADRIQ